MKPYAYSSAVYFTQNAMTTVLISHNPFRIETEILIDGKSIVDTSTLFKYLRTPMQDWVSDFLPSLIEDCNDDELEITFKGLPYNYEDLKSELDQFLQKNMNYDIELLFDACEDQTARLNTLETTLSELKTQTVVEELNCQEFVSSSAGNHLEVLVLGGSNPQQAVLINGLFGAGLYNSQSEFQRILLNIGSQSVLAASALPLNPESIEDTIRSEDKPVVIYILNDQLKRSKTDFLETIAEQYRIRGKQNKQRFLFVAETPAAAKRSLSSEFGIKNASVYALDEIALIQRQIEEYHSEVSLIRYLTTQCDNITQHLNVLEQELSAKATEHRDTQEIDQLETRALTLLYNSELAVSPPDVPLEINAFITQLCAEFNALRPVKSTSKDFLGFGAAVASAVAALQPITSQDKVETGAMRRAFIEYIRALPQKVRDKFQKIEEKDLPNAHVNIPQTLYATLKELKCSSATALLQELKDQLKNPTRISLGKETYINAIQNIHIEEKAFSFHSETLNYVQIENYKVHYKIVSSASNGQVLRQYQFYPGLIVQCCKCLSAETYSGNELLKKAQNKFASMIKAIKPVFESFFQELYSLYDSQYRNIYDQTLAEIDKAIQEQAQNLRYTASISSDELARLQYIQAIKERIVKLTCLGGETSNG